MIDIKELTREIKEYNKDLSDLIGRKSKEKDKFIRLYLNAIEKLLKKLLVDDTATKEDVFLHFLLLRSVLNTTIRLAILKIEWNDYVSDFRKKKKQGFDYAKQRLKNDLNLKGERFEITYGQRDRIIEVLDFLEEEENNLFYPIDLIDFGPLNVKIIKAMMFLNKLYGLTFSKETVQMIYQYIGEEATPMDDTKLY